MFFFSWNLTENGLCKWSFSIFFSAKTNESGGTADLLFVSLAVIFWCTDALTKSSGRHLAHTSLVTKYALTHIYNDTRRITHQQGRISASEPRFHAHMIMMMEGFTWCNGWKWDMSAGFSSVCDNNDEDNNIRQSHSIRFAKEIRGTSGLTPSHCWQADVSDLNLMRISGSSGVLTVPANHFHQNTPVTRKDFKHRRTATSRQRKDGAKNRGGYGCNQG